MKAGREGAAAPPAVPPSLQKALRHLLRPLVRLLLANHVTYPVVSQLLKAVYVDVALREFPIEGRAQTDSRITLLTGIYRKDVKRLRGEEDAPPAAPASVHLGAQLVGRWTGTPSYLDREGRPRPLPRQAARGPSFDALVTSISTDIRPRAVLDELLRLGVVSLGDDDRVRLHVEAFVPTQGFDEKAWYLGHNVHDHLAAAASNLAGGRPPQLERAVYYGGFTRESVAELAKLAARVGTEALQVVNRRALELRRRDAGRRGAQLRMRFGVYFYDADREEEAARGDAEDGDE